MKLKSIKWTSYRLPFAGQFNTAQGNLKAREGAIIRLEAGNGLVGLGEAAPLPEFGGGTLADVLTLLEKYAPGLAGAEIATLNSQLDEWLERNGPGVAALACGLDMAACDLLAQAANQPVASFLIKELRSHVGGPAAKIQNFTVSVNATIGLAGREEAAQAAKRAVEAGFDCIKLKVGMEATVGQEVERVAAVRTAAGDGVKLRLDANGAWTAARAIEILRALAEYDIELVEQPTAAFDLQRLASVREAVTIPIAADEPVTSVNAARQLIETGAADILVIKPMVVGGLRAGRQIIELAEAAGLQAFVTTTLDSGVGIAGALHLAATLPEPRLHCGLATATLLTGTLVTNLPEVKAGKMKLTEGPGLGISLESAIAATFK